MNLCEEFMNRKSLFRTAIGIALALLTTSFSPCTLSAVADVHSSVPPAPSMQQATGRLVFGEKFFDFGTVTEGDIIKHTFKFKNVGSGPAKIVKTETSCGCTTLSGVIKEYAPGEEGEMEVAVDTKGKKGIVVKTVTVTMANNDTPSVEIAMPIRLEPPPHPKIEKLRNINAELACKSCHLESGVGETGVFLYHRVCAQCHGKKGVGGFGRALNDEKWQNADDGYIRKVIHGGLPESGMPSFVEGVTPPLTDEQVESLLQYIRKIRKN
ncbi:MAG TPA: DUF1573 domain-containing protein [Gallionellaceae bacterium]|nr:DUF1573 domain-containing protein [Gallionellaceae bacterium]